jgi:lysophospholipase L1-like esterase
VATTIYVGNSPVPPVTPLIIAPGARITLGIDSITIGYNASNSQTDTSFGMWLPLQTAMSSAFTAAGKKPPTFTNTGAVGQNTSGWLAGLNSLVLTTNPTDVFLILGTNDASSGAIPAATTQSNCVSAFTQIISSFPSVRIHVFGTHLYTSEQWPDGSASGPSNSALAALCNAAIYAAVAMFPANCRWYNMRQFEYTWEAANNTPQPGVATGLLTQDGTHPTKIGQRPAGQSGQEIGSAWAMTVLTLGLT